MAVAVVDQLEVVDVDDDDRNTASVASSTRERLLQPVEDQAAVGQSGQRVVQRVMAELRLGGARLSDVLNRGEHADPVRLADAAQAEPAPAFRAVGVQVAPLDLGDADHVVADLLREKRCALPLFRMYDVDDVAADELVRLPSE